MNRADYAAIAHWVPQDARVLDLGCGDGELLNFLRNERGATGYGVEIAADNILACLKNGVMSSRWTWKAAYLASKPIPSIA
jgi:methionine biosynthesis protein MetW